MPGDYLNKVREHKRVRNEMTTRDFSLPIL